MEVVEKVFEVDWRLFILSLFAILFFVKEMVEIGSYFKNKYRIKTGSDIDKETLVNRVSKLEAHDKRQYEEITKISKGVEEIKETLEKKEIKDKEKTVATLRSQLYDLHYKFMDNKSVDKSGLKTFLELGKIYEEAGGNDIYHDKLKPEVMALPIKGDEE